MTFFYLRLTVCKWTICITDPLLTRRSQTGLGVYQKRIYLAMILIAITFVAVILTIYLSCRPFYRYWQINPDPGNVCQPAISKPILWVSFVTNVSTDTFLFFIPIPMLWKSSLRLYKKVAATLVLSAGVLIIICATLKSIYVIVVSNTSIFPCALHICHSNYICLLYRRGRNFWLTTF